MDKNRIVPLPQQNIVDPSLNQDSLFADAELHTIEQQQSTVDHNMVSFDAAIPPSTTSISSSHKTAADSKYRMETSQSQEAFEESMRSIVDDSTSDVDESFRENDTSSIMALHSKNRVVRFIEKIPMAVKLLFVIGVPIVGVCIIGILFIVYESLKVVRAAEVTAAVVIENVVHELQIERGTTSLYYSALSVEYAQPLLDQWNTTNVAISALLSNSAYQQLTTNALSQNFQSLASRRQQHWAKTAPLASVLTFYNQFINDLLNLLSSISNLANSAKIIPLLGIFQTMARLKEFMGQQRALGSNAIGSGMFVIANYQRFVSANAIEKEYMTLLSSTASVSLLNSFQKEVINQTEYVTRQKMVNHLLDAIYNSNLQVNGTASFYWNNVTLVMTSVKVVLNNFATEILQQSATDATLSISGLVIAVLVIIIALILSVFFGACCSGFIVGPWKRVIDVQEKSIRRFVPTGFMKLMGFKTISQLKLGQAKKKHLAVMFSDIRNFTGLSEEMNSPEQVFLFLNAYLSVVGPIIRKYNGYIDKFLADGYMALFVNANQCVNASLEIQQAIEQEFNQRIAPAKGFPQIRAGNGIHFGRVMIGALGESERIDGTIIGDTANLASRIEGLTKYYHCKVMATMEVLHECSKKKRRNFYHQQPLPDVAEHQQVVLNFKYRYLGRVIVKGKNKPVKVVELLDDKYDQSKLETLSTFNKAMQYMWNNQFDRAKELFEAILTIDPLDKFCFSRKQQCETLSKQGHWDGIDVMEDK